MTNCKPSPLWLPQHSPPYHTESLYDLEHVALAVRVALKRIRNLPDHPDPHPTQIDKPTAAHPTVPGSAPPSLEPPETNQQLDDANVPLQSFPSETLSEVFRHSGWRAARNRVYRAMQRTKQNPSRRAAFADCGSRSYVLMSGEDPPLYRLAGGTCHDRFCVPCANQRSQTIALNVLTYLDRTPIRFVTLTLRSHAEPLALLMDQLAQAFAKLRRRQAWKAHVTGGVGFVEVKWSHKGQRWHPHLHLLVKGKFFGQRILSREWHHATGNSNVVDIRLVTSRASATAYVTKYAAKPALSTFLRDDDRLDEAILALRSRRLVVTFGTWRGIMLTPKPDEDAWINLGSFETVVAQAAIGHDGSREALYALVGDRVHEYIALVPQCRPPPPEHPPNIAQLDFLDWRSSPVHEP